MEKPRAPARQPAPTATDGLCGTVVDGRYRVLEKIGEGGMATVYLAERVADGRRRALKVLDEELARDPEVVRRFHQEARAVTLIRHPNIVEIDDVGVTADKRAFFAMELLEGEDLATTLEREGPLPWPRLQAYALQICAALAAAHRQSIIHRDVKPENCFRSTSGGVEMIKVLDFGIAKDLGGSLPDRPKTAMGLLCGSPEYLAPEAIMATQVDARSDVYSLGVTLYELLCGHHPFEGAAMGEMLASHVQRPPPPFSRWGVAVAPEVEAIVQRCLAKAPADRYPSMDALAAAIRDPSGAAALPAAAASPVARPSGARRRRAVGALVVAGALVVLAGVLALLLGQPPAPGPSPGAGGGSAEASPEVHVPGDRAEGTGSGGAAGVEAGAGGDAATGGVDASAGSAGVVAEASGGAVAVEGTGGADPRPSGGAVRLPRELGEAAIVREIKRSIEAGARACLRDHTSLVRGQRFEVSVKVEASGRAQATAEKLPKSPAARCIDELVRGHRFPASQRGGAARYAFTP